MNLENPNQENPVIKYLTNSTDYQIVMLLVAYHELSLTDLEQKSGKSKATIWRHINKMEDDKIIENSKEILVRGDRKAKYYKLAKPIHQILGSITPNDMKNMTPEGKNNTYKLIRATVNTSVDFCVEALKSFKKHLDGLDSSIGGELDKSFDNLNFGLTFNFLTELQYKEYMQLSQEFGKKYMEMLIRTQKEEPEAEKSHFILDSILPIKEIFEIRSEKTNTEIISENEIAKTEPNSKNTQKIDKKRKSKNTILKQLKKELRELEINWQDCLVMQNSNIIEMDLSNHNLSMLPESIQFLDNLENLNLENNDLTELPDYIDILPSLKILDISKNPFSLEENRLKRLKARLLLFGG